MIDADQNAQNTYDAWVRAMKDLAECRAENWQLRLTLRVLREQAVVKRDLAAEADDNRGAMNWAHVVTPIDRDINLRGVDVARPQAKALAPLDPRDPDPSREGVFRDHNCARCKSGAQPERCPNPGNPRNCDTLYARND